MNQHLLSMHDVSAEDVIRILDTAESFREVGTRVIKKVPALRGRTVVNLFYENSTRTRISFELAAKRLSADVINFSSGGSSVSKGESLKDTALTLQAMGADAIVIRHSSSGSPFQLTKWVRGHVLNAGDGTHEHPTQALLDLYTMRERLGRLEGLRVAIVGDVLHSRVARSLSFGLVKMGADVTLVGPATLIPADAPQWGVHVSHDLDEVLSKLDVCYLLRVQTERQRLEYFPSVREYARLFGLNRSRVSLLPEGSLIMHPGSDEPWRRDRLGRRRPAAERDRGPGHERHRGPDGAALPAAGRSAGRRRPRRCPMASPELLFRGARVVDPRAGLDEVADVHVRDGVVADVGHGLDERVGRDRRLRRAGPRARAGRPAHAPARTGVRAEGDGRDRARGRPPPAATRRSRRWRTPIRSPTTHP